MATIRVRQILSNLNVNQKTALKKLLPPKLSVPDCVTHKYPSALLGIFPEDEVGKYAHLGILTEELLRLPSGDITVETLMEVLRGYLSDFTDDMETKLRKSVTTQPYLDCVKATRVELEKVLRSGEEEGPLKFEEEVVFGSVAGHPDMWNKTQVFEVKTTGMLKENWTQFLFQAFSYGALMPSVKDIYLVLPLQKLIWHSSMASWSKRTEFRTFMTSWSDTAQTDRVTAHVQDGCWFKLDIEGGEYEVLPEILARGVRPSIISMDIHSNNLKGAELVRLLEKSGYRLQLPHDPKPDCVNIVAELQ
jgi:hypothetical protein